MQQIMKPSNKQHAANVSDPPVIGVFNKQKQFDPPGAEILSPLRSTLVQLKVGLHIVRLALREYKSLTKVSAVLTKLFNLKKAILGAVNSKVVKVDGRYYHYLYAPGYPSPNFDQYIMGEFNRIMPTQQKANALTFIHLAVTKKCPLKCEHCLEWHNLNKPESLDADDLAAIVDKFRTEGIAQFHFSGGEPMVRVKDMLPLIKRGRGEPEFYILTSGFNFTAANAGALKAAGLTGVVISLDHFDAAKHDRFRGSPGSFTDVMQAVHHAHANKLVVALTICVTRAFLSWENLLRYAALAKKLNVAFIQILEPRAVGHYEGKDIFLDNDHLQLLDRFFCTLNLGKAYQDYPIVIYHGYYQRRIGCLAGGNRTLYIDSGGWVNACPFCHTKNVHIKSVIGKGSSSDGKLEVGGCEIYVGAGE